MKKFIIASTLVALPLFAACDPGEFEEEAGEELLDQLNVAGGGNEIRETSWAAVGVVKGSGSCTGTAVAPRKVVTAAHCFDGWNSGNNVISSTNRAKAYFDQRGGAGSVGITKIAIEPRYKEGARYSRYDIAVLTTDADLSPTLPVTSTTVADNSWFIGVGYGYTEYDARDFGTKRSYSNRVDEVDEHHYQFDKKTPNGNRPTLCPGDSGGPMLVYRSRRWRIAGIANRISKKDCTDARSYHARIDLSYDWYRDQL